MGELNVLKCGLGTKGTKEDGGAFRCEEGHSVTGAAVGGPLLVRSASIEIAYVTSVMAGFFSPTRNARYGAPWQ